MSALSKENPPEEVFFVATGSSSHGAYLTRRALRSALKTNNAWVLHGRSDDGRRWVKTPHPDLVIMRAEIGSPVGWADVTEEFVKDGAWAW